VQKSLAERLRPRRASGHGVFLHRQGPGLPRSEREIAALFSRQFQNKRRPHAIPPCDFRTACQGFPPGDFHPEISAVIEQLDEIRRVLGEIDEIHLPFHGFPAGSNFQAFAQIPFRLLPQGSPSGLADFQQPRALRCRSLGVAPRLWNGVAGVEQDFHFPRLAAFPFG